MKNINSLRVHELNDAPVHPDGSFVVYWMQTARRTRFHYGLEYAAAWAARLGKPLLVYEAVRCDYPWASDRFHAFLLEGMAERAAEADREGWWYYPYVERSKGEGKGLVAALSAAACLVITDAFPAFITPGQNKAAASRSPVRFVEVDSNGVFPLALSEKASYSAFIFRRTVVQRHFKTCFEAPPAERVLTPVPETSRKGLAHLLERWPDARHMLMDRAVLLAGLPVDHSVPAVSNVPGTREAALKTLDVFIRSRLDRYAGLRNHPDETAYSGLSPYMHFGTLSAHEVVQCILAAQPAGWTTDEITYADGQSRGFFKGNPNVESFLDEFLTWREVGYHFCYHTPGFDRFETLPDWVRATLEEHDRDPRDYVYSLEELEQSRTHDPIWNAAQRQLVEEGVIHNYLRMLWGKKILEWSPDARSALDRMIHLNNKYALDGRDPNSYSGIMWVMGRFDRPWAPARPVFGTVRYMSSDSTRRKIRLKEYLTRFGDGTMAGSLFDAQQDPI